MTSKRFTYGHSSVYGWCVYDRERGHSPAYEACCEMLPHIMQNERGAVCESPVLLKSEYAAMSLCVKLNLAHAKSAR